MNLLNQDTIIGVFLISVAIFVYLFVYWRELKDDSIASQIFSSSIIVLIFSMSSHFVTNYFLKDYKMLILILVFGVSYIFAMKYNRIKLYEGFDAIVISTLNSLAFLSLFLYKNWEFKWIIFYVSIYLCILIFHLVRKNYKSFIWYTSGKRGFAGLFTVGVFFLFRSLLFFIDPEYLPYLNSYDIFVSGLISLSAFLNIFMLAKI